MVSPNSPHATSAASAATGPAAPEEVHPPGAAAPVTPVKQRGDLGRMNKCHRGGSANVYTPQPSHHVVAVPGEASGAESALGPPATLTSAATEPTTTEPTAALTTSGAGSTRRISGWAALPSDLQAHVFTYLTLRRGHDTVGVYFEKRSVGATLDFGPLAGPLTTIDFLALAATCSSAWAIYSASREQLWRAALSHRVKVSGGQA